MKGYLEDLRVGGRPMTDKELADHYKHLYSEVKKQKDDVVEYIKTLEIYGYDTNVYETSIGNIKKDESYITTDEITYSMLAQKIEKLQSNWNSLREWLKNKIDNFQDDVSEPILHEQMTMRVIYEYMENLDKMNELEGKDKK